VGRALALLLAALLGSGCVFDSVEGDGPPIQEPPNCKGLRCAGEFCECGTPIVHGPDATGVGGEQPQPR
jgi:hypothetical protein